MARIPQIGRSVRRIALAPKSDGARAIRERWPDEELYTSFEVCKLIGIENRTLRKWHFLGCVPKPTLTVPYRGLHGYALVYSPKDIEAIIKYRDNKRWHSTVTPDKPPIVDKPNINRKYL